jgi:transcriptional regulator with XRE-family HTH domain
MERKSSYNFRTNLRLAMETMGVSQYEVARDLQMGRPYLNRILVGKAVPTLTVCDRLARFVDCPLAELVQSTPAFRKRIRVR